MMMQSETPLLVKRHSGKNQAVTMRDVAQASGFSPATVSIVLNNAPLARYIAPATKKRIEEVAKKLGYRPNAMARFLRSKRSHSVGVMFFDITDPFCTPVLRGIENALYQSSYVQIFADAHNQRNRFERYLEMLLEHHVEALIVVANWLFVDIQLLADLSKRNITAATIGWEMPGDAVSSVMVDNEAGGRLALEHLHQLGHHKIAFIRGPKMLIDSGPRWKGIQKFAHAARLEHFATQDESGIGVPRFHASSGAQQLRRLGIIPLGDVQVQPGRTALGTCASQKEIGADHRIHAVPSSSKAILEFTLPRAEKLAKPPRIRRRAATLQPWHAQNALLLLRWL